MSTTIAELSDIKEQIAESSIKLINAQSKYIKQMSVPERVFEKINSILNRIITFEESINELGISISQTQLLGNSQMNLIQEQITAIQKKTDLAVSYQELADDELKAVYDAQTKAIKQLNEKYCTAINNHGDDFASAMNDFKHAYEDIVKECKSAVEAKRDEYIAEIRKSIDLEAQNKYLSNLAKIPELIVLLSSIETDVKTQPEVSEKVSKVLGQLDGVKQTLDSMNKKIAMSSETIKHSKVVSKKPSVWSLFVRKK